MKVSHRLTIKPLYHDPNSFEIDGVFYELDWEECRDLHHLDLSVIEKSFILGVRCYVLMLLNAVAMGLISKDQARAKRDFYVKAAQGQLDKELWQLLKLS